MHIKYLFYSSVKFLKIGPLLFLLFFCAIGCTNSSYEDEFLLYQTNQIISDENELYNYNGQFDELVESKASKINIFFDSSKPMCDYINEGYKYSKDCEYLSLIIDLDNKYNCDFYQYFNSNYNIFEYREYCKEVPSIRTSVPDTDDNPDPYIYMYIGGKASYLKIKNFKDSKNNTTKLINKIYEIEDNENELIKKIDSQTLNILVTTFSGEIDPYLSNFYGDISETLLAHNATYGIIQLNKEHPVYLMVFGEEEKVNSFINNFDSKAKKDYGIKSDEIISVIPNTKMAFLNEEINIEIENSIIGCSNIYFEEDKEKFTSYFPKDEYEEIRAFLEKRNALLVEINSANSNNKINGEFIINNQLYQLDNSIINLNKFSCQAEIYIIEGLQTFLSTEEYSNIGEKSMETMFEEIGKDFSYNKYSEIKFADQKDIKNASNSFDINKNNINILDESSITVDKIELIDESIKINYSIDTKNFKNNIPYYINVDLFIEPVFYVKEHTDFLQRTNLNNNIFNPLQRNALNSMKEIKSEKYNFVIIFVNKED